MKDDAVERMNLATPISPQLVYMQTGRLRWMGRKIVKSETRNIGNEQLLKSRCLI